MIGWSWHRLRAMSAAEIALRARRRLRDRFERGRLDRGGPRAPGGELPPPDRFLADGFRAPWVLDPARIRAWLDTGGPPGRASTLAAAGAVLEGRYRWLGAERDFGVRPAWRRDVVSGVTLPAAHASRLATAAPDGSFDLKHIWEPNLHDAFVTLARAFAMTGDARFRDHLALLWHDWMEQNPPYAGPNYLAPVETGLRLLSWGAALRFWSAREGPPRELLVPMWEHVVHQRRSIARNLSRHSSANNHLIGELASLFLADAAFPGLAPDDETDRLRVELERETLRQFAADGGNREQALHYHGFSLAFLLLARHLDAARGRAWTDAVDARLRAALAFLAASLDSRGCPFLYGDSDDSEVLPLDDGDRSFPRAVLAHGAWLFDGTASPDVRSAWLLGPPGTPGPQAAPGRPAGREDARPAEGDGDHARVFPDTGHVFLRRGRLEAHLNGGALGYLSIAAHGHADALSVQLRWSGEPIVVDPGTGTYRGGSAWREALVSTALHPTVTVDGRSQALRLGPFLWGRPFPVSLDAGGAGPFFATATLVRNGVRHRRTLRLDDGTTAVVLDELLGRGEHAVRVTWPLGTPEATPLPDGASFPAGDARIEARFLDLPPGSRVERGDPTRPGSPCVSPGYDRVEAASSLIWEGRLRLPARWRTVFRVIPETPR